MSGDPVRPFPLGPLLGAGAMVALALTAATATRLLGTPARHDTGTQLASRDLRFEDRADGAVSVFNEKDGSEVRTLAPGTNGFIRATLRGLARERKRESLGHAVPFRLTAWSDGRVTLEDLSTGRLVELEAFGPTNEGAFVSLLTASGQ